MNGYGRNSHKVSGRELVDYYDEVGNVLGHCDRHEAEDKNLITPNAIIFVFTKQGDIWLQQRAKNKKHFPGYWDATACGGIQHGEDVLLAATRELEEEAGLTCELHFVERFLNVFPDETGTQMRKRWSSIYVATSSDTPQGNHEVERFQAFTLKELQQFLHEEAKTLLTSLPVEIEKAATGYTALLRADG